ncbi:MAG: NUDIX hydrolase [Ancylobacter novellus]|uniref:NUDIX hydrolase n=1 Tax=Ancylobacter novellus TaxID=921 RepID=A0A2W5R108_ANCNO|nr:MAG: NUDIX hydrolase [Ancylobacter novellus]
MNARATFGEIRDRAVETAIEAPQSVGDGFRAYERFEVTVAGAGGAPLHQRRDILRVGPVVAVLAYDPGVGCFVLIRQFRIGAHLATGKGEIIELAAGLVDAGEATERAASRECQEEIGVTPRALLPMLTFLPSPGVSDEFATLFLGLVDSTQVPAEAGEPGESEHTRPLLVSVDEALRTLGAPFPGTVGNAFVLLALQWFALNHDKVAAFVSRKD